MSKQSSHTQFNLVNLDFLHSGHLYSSGSLYLEPDAREMDNKNYQGCDLIVDIDVDHFYTPCKEKHDLWYCKECGAEGTGMPDKC
ncbi:unnamed protein product, partial [marine sediment metagenome]